MAGTVDGQMIQPDRNRERTIPSISSSVSTVGLVFMRLPASRRPFRRCRSPGPNKPLRNLLLIIFVSQREVPSSMSIGDARIKTIDLYCHCMII